jgi:deoxyribonuclease V
MSLRSHSWDLSPQEARNLQRKLASLVIRNPGVMRIKTVAGIDVGMKAGVACAAVVVLTFPGLEVVARTTAVRPIAFPYIPGLLTFREGPVILDALDRIDRKPDLLIFDGQGIAHPRRMGIASHIGLLTDLPSIGCAKSRLCGRYQEPEDECGSHMPLVDRGETIGAILRTRANVKPVFVSIGHRVDLKTSIDVVLSCCKGYRLPETTRKAHRLAEICKNSSGFALLKTE